MSDEHESVALLPTNNATEPKSPTSVSDFDHERFFLDEKKIDSGTGIVLTEGCKRNEVKYEDLFLIDDKSARLLEPRPAFKFLAKYENYPAGYYSIRWRVKVFQNFQISYGFHFVVNVSYRKEEQDISGSLDVIMAPEILKPQDGDQCYTLVLEEMLVIQPHEGGNDIELELRSIENLKLHGTQNYSGFAVEHVEIRPINPQDQEPSTAASAPLVVTIPRDATPTHIIDIPRDQTLSTRNGTTRNGTTRNGTPPIVPISRLATSRGCRFLATLALSHDMAYITIWDVNSETDASVQYQSVASKEFEHAGIGDLAIGLSLSTRGDQVAIYQEPKIGQWSDGSNVQNGSFNFRVFGNPVAESASAGHTTGYELREVHFQELNTFVGYGKFLEEAENSDWEANDFSTAPLDEDELEDGGTKKNGVTKNDTAMPVDSIFVACNGLTLKVFTTSTSSKDFWSHKHSISLEGLTPTLSRRITCKLMMESISSNTFLWLDDDGLSCTIWNLKTGSNLTYICRSNNARFKDAAFRNNSKMAISPDESMVALASIDGSLTTFSARTGIAIDVRKFPGYKIEHVGFHDRDDHLFVILRDSATFILETRILDAFGLKSDIIVDKVPALTLNTSILAFFYPKGHKRGGMVCEAAYSKINCYISHQPTLRNFTRDPAIAHDKTVHKINVTANGTTVCYQLKVLVHRELVPQGDGATYWVVRVEVHEVNEVAKSSRLIFSFVPEPWVRKRTTDVSNGGDLLMASFIGRDGGFAVIGMQTLQIWNVPTLENPKCSLVFIWSQLKRKIGDVSSEKEKSVCDYYVEIQKPKIYSDDTGGHSMEYLLDGSSPTAVAMPKVFDNRYVFLSCCRSIYLIAAAYAFSRQECTKRKQDSQKVTFTYEDHAEAIACFTLAYINRVISIKNIGNEASASANNVPLATSDHDWHENISTRESRLRAGIRRVFGGVEKPQRKKHTQHEVATLLTLLLDHPRLQESNHIFVEGLLKHADGEWVPRTNRSLNPVRRVIKAKNHQLLESFVDYCTRNAMKYHPAYMVPSMQCLKGLSELYPHILSEMFRKASYIPAHNHDYAAKHAKIANLRFLSYWSYWSYFIPWSADQNTSQGIDDFKDPIFYLRSQLRISDQPHTQFPETQSTPKKTERSHDIYVCPFPGLSSYGRHNSWSEDDNMKTTGSAFTKLAGKKFFGSPAMMATLSFKWKMYGFSIWLVRFTMLLAYFGCVIAITSKQVLTSTTPDAPSQDQITERYLLNWRGFIYATAIFAIVIILYDFKCLKSMKQVV
ncbi:hypothetical protein EDD21DRAFT_442432 [Dissophora ornata]|nr:hypothetical protein EDD21DRAFT_442432 [Dissophora ornata]